MNDHALVIIKRIFKEEVRLYLPLLGIAIFCMVISGLTTAAMAYFIDPAIQKIFIEKNADLLLTLPLWIMAISVIRGATTYGQSQIIGNIGQKVVSNLQKRMFASLIRADFEWLGSKHSAKIVTSFVNDAIYVRDTAANVLVSLVKESVTLLGCAAMMFYQDWQLASAALFVFLPAAVLIRRLTKQTRKNAHAVFEETGTLSSLIAETLKGMRMVRIYTQEDYEIKRSSQSIARRLRHLSKGIRNKAASAPLVEALTGVGMAAAIFYGGWRGLQGEMQISDFASFITAMMLAYQPGKALSNVSTQIQDGVAAAIRIFKMIDMQPKIVSLPGSIAEKKLKGDISFKNVCFDYGGQTALDNISFTAHSGDVIAFVGASGAGKTTALNLIPRFFDVSAGEILLDAIPIKDFSLPALRENMALVSQDPFLFDGTIYENVIYGRNDADEEQVKQALGQAAALDFVQALPAGLQTQVGEAGSKLSGGQKQRIAIARAFLKNAPILLLDEATSALDVESEHLIQESLRKLMIGKTTFIIAHRLSTIKQADQILVFDKGKIVESGTHDDLIMDGGLYARLYKKFQKGEEGHS